MGNEYPSKVDPEITPPSQPRSWGAVADSVFDELAGSIGGMQGGGTQGNQNMQQLTPSRMPSREAPVSPLAASAEQRGNALGQMQQSHQQLSATRAATSTRLPPASPRALASRRPGRPTP